MSAASRRKGAAGERELLRLLADDLGIALTRNLAQTRAGGADCLDLPGLALEVKRHERADLPGWWRQACQQAEATGRAPILAYRASRKPWRFVVRLSFLNLELPGEHVAELDYPAALAAIQVFINRRNAP